MAAAQPRPIRCRHSHETTGASTTASSTATISGASTGSAMLAATTVATNPTTVPVTSQPDQPSRASHRGASRLRAAETAKTRRRVVVWLTGSTSRVCGGRNGYSGAGSP